MTANKTPSLYPDAPSLWKETDIQTSIDHLEWWYGGSTEEVPNPDGSNIYTGRLPGGGDIYTEKMHRI